MCPAKHDSNRFLRLIKLKSARELIFRKHKTKNACNAWNEHSEISGGMRRTFLNEFWSIEASHLHNLHSKPQHPYKFDHFFVKSLKNTCTWSKRQLRSQCMFDFRSSNQPFRCEENQTKELLWKPQKCSLANVLLAHLMNDFTHICSLHGCLVSKHIQDDSFW